VSEPPTLLRNDAAGDAGGLLPATMSDRIPAY
jgi:hypothetical protein